MSPVVAWLQSGYGVADAGLPLVADFALALAVLVLVLAFALVLAFVLAEAPFRLFAFALPPAFDCGRACVRRGFPALAPLATARARCPAGELSTPEATVQFQNQGEAEETDVVVSVTAGDAAPLTVTVPSISPGATESVTIPLTPTPSGLITLEIEVQGVPGEQVLENNVASYQVDFG